MKISKEIRNGFIVFIGIGLYFLLMVVLQLQQLTYLRLGNFVFLIYGVHLTVKSNFAEGNKDIISNAISAFLTCFIGTFLSVFALLIYIHLQGGERYMESLASTFLFGGDPSVASYCLSLSLEGAASSIITSFIYILYTINKYPVE